MGLPANFSKKQLFKTIKAIAPVGEKRRLAFATAAKFGIKKGASGKLMQGKAVKLMKELKEGHVLKAHPQIGGRQISTAGETAKHLLADVTAPRVDDAAASKAAAETAFREKLAEKQKINEAMKAKTAAEHPTNNTQKEKESTNVAAARGKDTVRAGQESAAAVEAEIEKRSGHLSNKEISDAELRERSAPVQLTKAPIAAPRHDESPSTKIEGTPMSKEAKEETPPTPLRSGFAGQASSQPTPEPAKGSDAIEMDIG